MMVTDAQRRNALRLANEKRGAHKALRLRLSGKHATLADVLLPSVMVSIQGTQFLDVLRWVPMYGPSSGMRWQRMGQAAVRDNVNLLQPCGQMSQATRQWICDTVAGVTSVQRLELEVEETSDEGMLRLAHALAYTERRLRSAERQRDEALRRVKELDSAVSGCQLTMPTVEAERMLAQLADAVEEHKRGLSNGAPNFADADRELWEAKDEILASSVSLAVAA